MLECFGLARRRKKRGADEARYRPAAVDTPDCAPIKPPPSQQEAPPTPSPEAEKGVPSTPSVPTVLAWQEQLASTLPFSVVVLTSDTKQVLHQSSGTEPAAAQLLNSTLKIGEGRSADSEQTSILACLLGPQLEAEVLDALAQDRAWKGTIVGHAYQPAKSGARALANPASNKSNKSVRWGCANGEAPHCGTERAPTYAAEVPEEAPMLFSESGENVTSTSQAFAQSMQRSKSLPKLRQRSILMSESDIERLLSGGSTKSDECTRTRTLLKELSRAHTSERVSSLVSSSSKPTSARQSSQGHASHKPDGSGGNARSGTSESAGRGSTNTATGSSLVNNLEASRTQADMMAQQDFVANRASPFQTLFEYQEGQKHSGLPDFSRGPNTTGASFCDNTAQNDTADLNYSFDVSVSHLKAACGAKDAPIVVVISKSSDLGQAQAMLSALAEVQLELLSNIMPLHAIQFLALESREAIPANIGRLAHRHKNVTLLFMDICGFTTYSKSVEPESIMFLLNNLFSAFDQLTDECNVHKLETAGDCYLVSGGVVRAPNSSANGFSTIIEENEAEPPAESAKRVVQFAVKALERASTVMMPGTQTPVQMRVGIHTGDCVSGLIGSKLPKFSCFGDAMNVASRMESTGVPGHIHISETTYQLLRNEQWEWVPTGGVEVKGKGLMNTFISPSLFASRKSNLVVSLPEVAPCNYLKTACTLLQHVDNLTSSLPLPMGMHIDPPSGMLPPIQLGEEEEGAATHQNDERIVYKKQLLTTI